VLLIVGCGDVGLRVLRLLRGRWRVLALTSSPSACPLRAARAPCRCWATWTSRPRWAAWAAWPMRCCTWRRRRARAVTTAHAALLQALARGGRVQRLVYASTTGVYGDCAGRALRRDPRRGNPATDRARAASMPSAAAALVRPAAACRQRAAHPRHLRRRPPGGHPRERLQRGTPVLRAEDDVYTNHIHADDLARACVAALLRGRPQRVCTPATTPSCAWATTSTWRPTCAACRARRASRAPRRCRRAVADAAELHERIAPARQPRLKRELRCACATRRWPTGLLRG
jgi:nucleoside-diphosphate-sugar epimerase